MRYTRKLLSAAVAVSLMVQAAVSAAGAFAIPVMPVPADSSAEQTAAETIPEEEETALGLDGSGEIDYQDIEYIGDEIFEGDTLPCSENDPGYHKYVTSKMYMPMVASVWGSNNLTHQSRFELNEKVYGIDVSKYQYTIDWTKVKNAGVRFVIIRVGYRGYGNGQLVLDPNFKTYIEGAKAAGLDVGVYFYTQAINTAEAKAEADFVIKNIKGYSLDLPVYYDIEGVDYDVGRLDAAKLSKSQMTSLCTAFCDRIKEYGYDAGVYANKSWLTYQIDGAALAKKYPIWLAHYTTNTDYTGGFHMWQYTGSGSVDGISVYVDVNVRYDEVAVGKVAGLQATSDGQTLSLKWNAVSGCSGYGVFRKPVSGGTETLVKEVSSTSADVDLTDTDCYYYVKAFKKTGSIYYWGDESDKKAFQKNKVYGVAVSGRTAVALSLSWNGVKSASGYEIQIYDNSAKNYLTLAYTTDTSYTASELSGSTVYSIKIRPYFNASSTGKYMPGVSTLGVYSDELKTPTNPLKVPNVRLVSKNSTSAALEWDRISSAFDGYQIYQYDPATAKYTLMGTSEGESYTVTGLDPVTDYTFRVRAYYDYNGKRYVGNFSPLLSVTTDLDTPSGLKWVWNSSSSITLNWTAVKAADKYTVYEVVGNTSKAVGTSATNSLKISGLNKDPHRYYVTASKTKNGVTYTSAASSKITLTLALTAPQGIKLVKAGTNYATISWDAVDGAEKYYIYLNKAGTSAYTRVATVTSAAYTFDLSENTDYNVKIRPAIDTDIGASEGAVSEIFSMSTKTSVPTNFSVTAYSSYAVRIKWDAVPAATGYNIYVYDSVKKAYVLDGTSKTPEYRLGDSKVNTEYNVKVQPDYNGTPGDHSEQQLFYTRPNIPTGLKWTGKTENSLSISWNKVSEAKFYRVYIYDTNKGCYVRKADVFSGTSYTITGLTAARRYKVKVAAVRKADTGYYLSVATGELTMGTTGYKYYPNVGYTGSTLDGGLKKLGISKITDDYLKKLAKTNSVANYTGTHAQRLELLRLLKKGRLMIPASGASSLTPPTGLKWTGKTESSVTFTWNKLSGATAYRVYMYDASTGKFVQKKDVATNSCTITGLTKARRYKFRVTAIDAAGETGASSTLSTATAGYKYYSKISYTGPYLYAGLTYVGVYGTTDFYKKLAQTNSVYYTGTDAQHTELLNLLKNGKLMIPQ